MLDHLNYNTIAIGLVSTVGSIFFSKLISLKGWKFTASLTPVAMGGLAVVFFSLLFREDKSSLILGYTPLALIVFTGSLQNCLSKAGKYSIFDATKEIAFLKESKQSRIKAKAAIDGIGSGLGKSGSSLVYQAFLFITGGIASATPYIALILMVIMLIWILALKVIGKRFKDELS